MAKALRLTFVALVVVYAGVVAWAATVLPDRVPSDWGAGRAPTGWDSRAESIISFAVLGVIIVATFGLIWLLVARSKQLVGLNFPHREYWTAPERLEQTRARLSVDVGVLACLGVAWSCSVPPSIVVASAAPDHALPWGFFAALIAFVALTLARVVWMLAVRWRIPSDDRFGGGPANGGGQVTGGGVHGEGSAHRSGEDATHHLR